MTGESRRGKTPPGDTGSIRRQDRRNMKRRDFTRFAAGAAGALVFAAPGWANDVPTSRGPVTGLPLPRYVSLKGHKGRKVILLYWAGGGDPLSKIAAMDPGRYGITLSTGGNILPALVAYKAVPGMEGATYYYYGIPKNPINDWLVKEHEKRFGTPPDFFTAGGMAAALAVVKALKESPSLKTEDLIKTMAGMSWDTPKGEMTFRKSDHQALQDMYAFKIKVDPNVKWAIPELVRVIKPSEMNIPVGRHNKN